MNKYKLRSSQFVNRRTLLSPSWISNGQFAILRSVVTLDEKLEERIAIDHRVDIVSDDYVARRINANFAFRPLCHKDIVDVGKSMTRWLSELDCYWSCDRAIAICGGKIVFIGVAKDLHPDQTESDARADRAIKRFCNQYVNKMAEIKLQKPSKTVHVFSHHFGFDQVIESPNWMGSSHFMIRKDRAILSKGVARLLELYSWEKTDSGVLSAINIDFAFFPVDSSCLHSSIQNTTISQWMCNLKMYASEQIVVVLDGKKLVAIAQRMQEPKSLDLQNLWQMLDSEKIGTCRIVGRGKNYYLRISRSKPNSVSNRIKTILENNHASVR